MPSDEWIRQHSKHLRPEDIEVARSYTPATAGLYLLALNELREMVAAIFPGLTDSDQRRDR